MPPIVPEDTGAQGQGANASVPFGQAGEMNAASHALASQVGTSSRPTRPPGGTPPAAAAPGGMAPAPPQGPSQPPQGPPRGPDGRIDTSKVFSDLTVVPSWRQQAGLWSNHPAAGAYLKLLGRLSQADHRGSV
jgi:hypothetical protein